MFKYGSGYTLIELLIAMIIITITAMLAVPSFSNMYTRYQLQSTAQGISDKLKLAQSESGKRRVNVYFNFQTGSSWCYGLNDNATCNCSVANSCLLNSNDASTTSASNNISGISLTSSGVGLSTYFDKLRGTASTVLALTLTKNGLMVNITMNNMGGVSIQ